MIRRIVIVGHGVAGLTAGDTLRSEGFAGELTVLGQEAHAPYSRPALSKGLLAPAGDDPAGDDGDLRPQYLTAPSEEARAAARALLHGAAVAA